MNARVDALIAPLAKVRSQTLARWQALAPRERRGAGLAAAVLGVAAVWGLGVQPALRTMREAPPAIDRLESELQQMQALAGESRALRTAPRVAPTQAAESLKAAAARLGDKARLVVQGERATLTLTGVDAEALRGLLAEVRSAAHARPVEAQLVRGAKGYDGKLVLALGGPP